LPFVPLLSPFSLGNAARRFNPVRLKVFRVPLWRWSACCFQPDLIETNWTDITATVQEDGTNKTVRLELMNTNRFFRLKEQP
jgi:hypothetical protein